MSLVNEIKVSYEILTFETQKLIIYKSGSPMALIPDLPVTCIQRAERVNTTRVHGGFINSKLTIVDLFDHLFATCASPINAHDLQEKQITLGLHQKLNG